MSPPLSQEIQKAYDQLTKAVSHIPAAIRCQKIIEGTGGRVSVTDLISYQIGYGKCVIRWYEEGVQGKQPEIPGEGFIKWDYVALANYFYQKYPYDASMEQLKIFHETVHHILHIIEKEHSLGNLDKQGVWGWCTLASGKQWPLSKWIKVNTVSAYKRAASAINKLNPFQ